MKGLKLFITICLSLALLCTGWAAASDGTPDYWKLAEQAYNHNKFAEAKPLYEAFFDEREPASSRHLIRLAPRSALSL